jgi:predicted GH43/DUF377 family glycosyl hydrolase
MPAVVTWAIGPFTRPLDQPVIQPTGSLVFDCPVTRQPVRWAENHTFNPAAVVHAGKVHVFFRAEDGRGDDIGMYCSRIGHAVSADGLTMKIQPSPVLFPADDEWKAAEWPGGCEDPRIVESDAGGFALYYTMYNRRSPVCIGVATSPDLQTWIKHGPIFDSARDNLGWHKAAGVVQKIQDGRLIAARIHGRYWMYWGEDAVHLATSTDLVKWTPVRGPDRQVLTLIAPRRGRFDSALTEVGPPPVLTNAGIVLLYNGKNHAEHGDPFIAPGAYAAGQVLFDKDDPTKVLDRLDRPFLKPEADFEKTGQYRAGTVFIEGLVLFKGRWHLYYGAADTAVGVAVAANKTEAVDD